MNRIGETTILIVFAALATNCGGGGDDRLAESRQIAEAHDAEGTDSDGAAGSAGGSGATDECIGAAAGCGSGGDDTLAVHAVAWLQPDSCERLVAYEVRDVRDERGMPVTDYTCEWTFTDGAVSNSCAGNREFGELPRTHSGTVVVRDSATGATTTATTELVKMIEPQGIEIFTSSYEPMQFEYEIDRQYGCGAVHTSLDIQPAENILTPGPWSIHSQRLQVSTPGVYTITYTVEGCAPEYARTCVTTETARVTVAECR
jgi:hypothetical protein